MGIDLTQIDAWFFPTAILTIPEVFTTSCRPFTEKRIEGEPRKKPLLITRPTPLQVHFSMISGNRTRNRTQLALAHWFDIVLTREPYA